LFFGNSRGDLDMVEVVTAANRQQFGYQLLSMFEDRKRVFVDLLRWDLNVSGRFEIDQFDDEVASYLLISDDGGNHMGSMRLLRTDRPHILGSLFSYLCDDGVPANQDTFEITRLCLCPQLPAAKRVRLRNQLISAMVDERFRSEVLEMGWRCRPLGPSQLVHGSMIGAFSIEIDEATPRALQTTGIYIPGCIVQPDSFASVGHELTTQLGQS
jgi:N-acyl-L-homoserine lactone synthetase